MIFVQTSATSPIVLPPKVTLLLLQIPSWIFWTFIGWGLGFIIRRFISKLAIWVAIVMIGLLILTGLGVVTVNTQRLMLFFFNISDFVKILGRQIETYQYSAFIRLDLLSFLFFFLGFTLGIRKGNSGEG